MNYWVISPNATENKAHEPILKDKILSDRIVFMGWDVDNKYGRMFISGVQKGDVVLVAQGANKNKRLYLAGIVSTNAVKELYPGTPQELWNRRLESVINYREINDLNLDFRGAAYVDANRIPAIYRLKPDSNAIDKVIIEKLDKTLKKIKSMAENKEIIDLLIYKKQIILQGPPGTGKTWFAKKIAEEMTAEKNVGSPLQKIEEQLKSFNDTIPEISAQREKVNSLLETFQREFKKENLREITLDKYCFGNGSNNSFCWWLEYGLWELGGYTGEASKFKIYWSKRINGYKKSGFIKHSNNDVEAMKSLAEQLFNVANKVDLEEALKLLSPGLVLKILSSYNPDVYFPINNEKCIINSLKLLGVDYSNLNIIEKNKLLQNTFLEKKAAFKSSMSNHEFMHFLFDNFDIKGNIEIQKANLILKGKKQLVQFHPAYTYEDFVRGITTIVTDGKVYYRTEDRVIASFAKEAIENPRANYVLIVDEINRANLPSVLGELIYALEYRDESVESMYAIDKKRELMLPKNLFIIGTMNTADRSTGRIDYAIRRRFAFREVLPIINPISLPEGKSLFKKVSAIFIKDTLESIDYANPTLHSSEYLADEFRPEDVWLGHSYFITNNILELKMKLQYEIKPILKEYVKDGLLNESALSEIEKLTI